MFELLSHAGEPSIVADRLLVGANSGYDGARMETVAPMPATRLLVTVAALFAATLHGGTHFGFPIAVFSYDLHPSLPLEEHAAGNLGIIRPSYARSYLYSAYRWIEGAPMSAEEQEALSRYWQEKLGLVEPEHGPDGGWAVLRQSLDIPPPDMSGPGHSTLALSGRNYVYYRPCGGNAPAVAAERLRDHIARFGKTSKEVRAWATAQDLVFRACTKALNQSAIPGDAPADVHTDIRRDRAYQTAATLFNGGQFAEAEKRFRAIAPDPSYPGGLWAPYMVGRSILWQARFEPDDAEYRRLLRKARFEFQNVLQNDRFAVTHDAARYLLVRILTAVDREPAARLLGIRLMSPLRAASRPQDLIQYFELLDAAVGSPYSKPTGVTARSVGSQDDMTDWILTFQAGEGGAAHAIERWRQTGSTSWLIAALCNASAGEAALGELLVAAAKIEPSPGWASVQYYRAERLIDAGRFEEGRVILDALVPTLEGRLSSANRARELRARASATFADALRHGLLAPTSFGTMTSHGAEREPWKWNDWAENEYGPQTLQPLVAPALADILNASIPVERFAELAGGDAEMPPALRQEMLLTAWIRAVLLERWDLATPLAAACVREVPATARYLEPLAAASGRSRDLLVKLTLLRFPGISVEVRSGIGRNAPLQDIQRTGLNWWWWQDHYQAGLGKRPSSTQLDWTSPDERRQADREWARIVALGEGHDWIYAGVLRECDVATPPAPCAEALYRVGASYAAVGYWHDPVSPALDLYNLDHSVAPILERAFPRSSWTRSLLADIEQLQRNAYGEDQTYRWVVPYPR